MAFLTGAIFIHAPAAALNNHGADNSSTAYDNATTVKFIRTKGGNTYPYVSAQAVRYWLRTTLERERPTGWEVAPVDREGKIAYTDGNPIQYADDDLFGYMRAPGSSDKAVAEREARSTPLTKLTPKTTITRISPFRVSTFMSLAPVNLTTDFGTMVRNPGDPVIHSHNFYSAVLKGLFSLDLHAAGTFSYANRTGYRNLDDIRIKLAQERGLQLIEEEKSYRLSDEQRRQRVSALVESLAIISGGAKQALHYTDVTPTIVLAMVIKGGNNPLQFVLGANSRDGGLEFKPQALKQTIEAWSDQILSPLYVGWVEGFYDEELEKLKKVLEGANDAPVQIPSLPFGYKLDHPRKVLQLLASDFRDVANSNWLV